MDEETALRLIVAKYGAFLRREAEALGYDDRAVTRAVRSRRWIRIRHGAYTFPDIWLPAGAEDRHRIRSQAVLRAHGGRVLLSHQSAIVAHGLPVWGVDLSRVHVTRRDGSPGRSTREVAYHEAGGVPLEPVQGPGLEMTGVTRAVLEAATIASTEAGLVIADAALRVGLTSVEELRGQLDRMGHWPGTQHVRLVVGLADGHAESVGESRVRHFIWVSGLPNPVLQFKVYDGRGRLVGITDFAWPGLGLLGEFDGKAKYGRLRHAGEEPGDAVFREKKREDRLREATGWRMIRLVWRDLENPTETFARLRAAMFPAA